MSEGIDSFTAGRRYAAKLLNCAQVDTEDAKEAFYGFMFAAAGCLMAGSPAEIPFEKKLENSVAAFKLVILMAYREMNMITQETVDSFFDREKEHVNL